MSSECREELFFTHLALGQTVHPLDSREEVLVRLYVLVELVQAVNLYFSKLLLQKTTKESSFGLILLTCGLCSSCGIGHILGRCPLCTAHHPQIIGTHSFNLLTA